MVLALQEQRCSKKVHRGGSADSFLWPGRTVGPQRGDSQRWFRGEDLGQVVIRTHQAANSSSPEQYTSFTSPEEALVYILFLPSLLALIVIGSISLRDQFRFQTR